ncbi:MAG: dTDP-glucose 4,6-dehydratase [bacterium]
MTGAARRIAGKGKNGATRVLVTGGAGFIGANFVHHLMALDGYAVTVLDKLTYAGNLANLAAFERDTRFRFVQGDICDPAVVGNLVMDADVVVNFAAETHVDRSIDDAGSFVKTDTYGVYILLEAARAAKSRRFIQISTDEVYGEAGDTPSREDSPLMPASPYAASKAGGDRIAFSYFVTHNVPVVITRCSNNYGPYQYPEKMIPLFATNAIEGQPLPVYGSGKNTRDWIHVSDHCAALELLMNSEGVDGEVWNIGTGDELNILDIAARINRETGRGPESVKLVSDRPGHIRRHAVDSAKIRARLGWMPRWTFDKGLPATVQWYKENEAWWRPIKDGSFREYYRAHYDDRLKNARSA